MDKVTIAGTGCMLMDYVYSPVDFNSQGFRKYRSRQTGDGGLVPGQLVFLKELENFAEHNIRSILPEITGNRPPVAENLGGPAVVSLVHVAQLMNENADIQFYGAVGKDQTAGVIREILGRTPLQPGRLVEKSETTPFTYVLSDPTYDGGHGERTFINNIGAAHDLDVPDLPESFFQADITVFGGTALVPRIHDALDELLEKASSSYRIVNTVFDFRNERNNPGKPWPLGSSHDAFRNIDLLIMDNDEALKISGRTSLEEAIQYFSRSPLPSFIVTDGARPVTLVTMPRGKATKVMYKFPVITGIREKTDRDHSGDTTGAGDNFAGGVICSVARQIHQGKSVPDLREACSLGIVSGGFACTYIGGTYIESRPGEKLKKIDDFYYAYLEQEGLENI